MTTIWPTARGGTRTVSCSRGSARNVNVASIIVGRQFALARAHPTDPRDDLFRHGAHGKTMNHIVRAREDMSKKTGPSGALHRLGWKETSRDWSLMRNGNEIATTRLPDAPECCCDVSLPWTPLTADQVHDTMRRTSTVHPLAARTIDPSPTSPPPSPAINACRLPESMRSATMKRSRSRNPTATAMKNTTPTRNAC